MVNRTVTKSLPPFPPVKLYFTLTGAPWRVQLARQGQIPTPV